MNNSRLIFILLGVLFTSLVNAQDRVFIPDTAFRSFLCERYPTEMSVECDSINYGSDSITGDLGISGSRFYDLTGVEALTKLERLFIGKTSITTVPRLPESQTLTLINVIRGDVVGFEDDFIPVNNKLDVLNFSENKIVEFPNLTNVSLSLKRLYFAKNELTVIPDLNNLTLLSELNVGHNYLTFEDLLPVLEHPNYDSSLFVLTPQKEQTFTITEFELIEGTSGNYQLSVDEGLEGNSFQWYKDGSLFKTTTENVLEFESIQLSDTGNYSVVITNSNPFLQDLEITFSNEFEVKVIPSINGLTSETTTNCESHVVSLDETRLSTLSPDADYLLIDSLTGVSQPVEFNSFTLTTTGDFTLVQLRDDEVLQYMNNWVQLPELPVCNEYLTPDGDGVDDTYYFEEEGEIQIIGKSSTNRVNLNGPIIWDGNDNNGDVVAPGLYLIVLPGDKFKHLTVAY